MFVIEVVLLCLMAVVALFLFGGRILLIALGTVGRTVRVWRGDEEARNYGTTVFDIAVGQARHISFGDSYLSLRNFGFRHVVDPARIADGRAVQVGRGFVCPFFSVHWGLKWPYPWTVIPEVRQLPQDLGPLDGPDTLLRASETPMDETLIRSAPRVCAPISQRELESHGKQ
jgi:hypothetical protein